MGSGAVFQAFLRFSRWLEDMARWTTYPEDWPDMAQAGGEEAMARRPAQLGNTNESLARYRDEMLLEILKLHHKL